MGRTTWTRCVCFLHESVGRMSLSSGGWTHAPGHTPDQSAALPAHYGASQAQPGCQTVLMSVRVSVCHSGIRPLCLPGAGDESLRLQLSMDPGKSGEFRLTLQDSGGTGRSVVSSQTVVTVGFVVVAVLSGEHMSRRRVFMLAMTPHSVPGVYVWKCGEIKLLLYFFTARAVVSKFTGLLPGPD